MRVLILGGYGTFGFNIARLLKDEVALTIILAGRNLPTAENACQALLDIGGRGTYLPQAIDRARPLEPQIKTPPDMIIDATGPFQDFHGEDAARVIEYALAVKADYIDLSDDTRFIQNIMAYDGKAKAASITALSGLSSYPALTGAMLDYAKEMMPNPTFLAVGIAPSPHAKLGKNVLAAILSGAGRKQIYERENGKVELTYGLLKSGWRVIAPPGRDPLKPLLWVQVDSPTAVLMTRHQSLKTIRNYAAPQPVWMLKFLRLAARLKRYHMFPPLKLFTHLFHSLHKTLTHGEHRSGFLAELHDEAQRIEFHLTANGDDGPLIPSIPAAAIVKQKLGGRALAVGARSGLGLLSWADFAMFFDRLNIQYGHYESRLASQDIPVYRQLLGGRFETLPQELQSLHDIDTVKTYHGRADIIRGKNPLCHIVCAAFGFPKAGKNIATSIKRTPMGDNLEMWERTFHGRKMRSTQEVGTGPRAHMIVERFGPVAVNLAYYQDGEHMRVDTKGWRFFGLPLPRWLGPSGDVYEMAKNGKFHFHVDLRLPIIGRIVRYIGWFDPVPVISPDPEAK